MYGRNRNDIHVKVFGEIINGALRPGKNKTEKALNKLVYNAATITDIISMSQKGTFDNELFDYKKYGFRDREDFTLSRRKNYKESKINIKLEPKEIYPLNTPFYHYRQIDVVSCYYNVLIFDSFERVKIKLDYMFEILESDKKKKDYAEKNILKAEMYLEEAKSKIIRLKDDPSCLFNSTETYVYYMTAVFLIKTIILYEKYFKSSIDRKQSSEKGMIVNFQKELLKTYKDSFDFSGMTLEQMMKQIKRKREYKIQEVQKTSNVQEEKGNYVVGFEKAGWTRSKRALAFVILMLAYKIGKRVKVPALLVKNDSLARYAVNTFNDADGQALSYGTMEKYLRDKDIWKIVEKDFPSKDDFLWLNELVD